MAKQKSLFFKDAFYGVVFGLFYFVADLGGAALAIGDLIDTRQDSLILLGLTAVLSALVWAALFIGGALLWRKLLKSPSKVWRLILALLFLSITTVTGYFTRKGRHHTQSIEGVKKEISKENSYPVLWIVADTLRADAFYADLDSRGNKGSTSDFESPVIAKPTFINAPLMGEFAKRSTVFLDAEASAGWTIPSVASMITGIEPVTLYSARGFLPKWAPTIAERLSAAGYQTHALVDNALLEPRSGYTQGFDTFFQKNAFRFAFTFPLFRALPNSIHELLRENLYTAYLGAELMTDAAVARIDSTPFYPLSEQGSALPHASPFFYVHYMDPHYPYYPHPEIAKDPQGAESIHFEEASVSVRKNPKNLPSAEQMKFIRSRYQGEIKFLDNHLSRLINSFEKKFGEETVIIFTSDHGEEFLDHGELGHSHSLHREMVNVPLIIKWPKSLGVEPSLSSLPLSLIDLVPTVLDVLEISKALADPYNTLQGESILPRLANPLVGKKQLGENMDVKAWRPIFATQHRNGRRIYRYREGKHVKLTTFYRDKRGYPKRTNWTNIYDLANDPRERSPLGKEKRADLSPHLHKEEDTAIKKMKTQRDPEPVTQEQDEEALKALGYIQ